MIQYIVSTTFLKDRYVVYFFNYRIIAIMAVMIYPPFKDCGKGMEYSEQALNLSSSGNVIKRKQPIKAHPMHKKVQLYYGIKVWGESQNVIFQYFFNSLIYSANSNSYFLLLLSHFFKLCLQLDFYYKHCQSNHKPAICAICAADVDQLKSGNF